MRRRLATAALWCVAVQLATVGSLSGQVTPNRRSATESDAQVIRALRQRSNDAVARHDTTGIGASLAPTVIVLGSVGSATSGRDANIARYASLFSTRPDVVYRRTPVEVTVFTPWRFASESGTWTGSWTAPDGKVLVGGHYFAKWRESGGHWLIESESYAQDWCRGSAYCTRAP